MREPLVQKTSSIKPHIIKHKPFRLTLTIASIFCAYTLSFADTKVLPEEAFVQGQKYLEQANTPLAEVSLTRIPPSSPYAKLLAGSIAARNGDIDRTFLLLLPLQSNASLIKPAAASLHASLSNAYEKQGDSLNALDQLIRREAFITDPQAIEDNNKNIWRLLSSLSVQDLIGMRGESSNTATQGWIDLSLVAKSSDVATELATWFNSYPDHTATSFAKTLTVANPSANPPKSGNLPLKGNIALILPFDNAAFADKSKAFKLGLQAALNKNGSPNIIKDYASLGDQESFGDSYTYAKDEGASYFIGPLQSSELVEVVPVEFKPVEVELGEVELGNAKLEENKSVETKPVPVLSLLDSN
ncbi:MAG: penicillin-binding protein activator, partial [Methylotenera sp.]|nr:penicillin-binding protein activator [Methylotenera sp.]